MTPFTTLGGLQVDPNAPSPLDKERAAQGMNGQPEDKSQVYWAAREAKDVIAELTNKERAYYMYARQKGFTAMTRHMMSQYYGQDPEGAGWVTQVVGFDGAQDEYVHFRVNETRSYVKQLITMSIGQRPSFECSATNDDYDSIGQAETADSIIEYVYDAKYGEKKERATIEKGEIGGSAYSWCNWDATAGDDIDVPVLDPATGRPPMRQLPDGTLAPVIDPKTGKPPTKKGKTGDLVLASLGWWDQFSETSGDSADDHLWRCVRQRRSKWELAGKFPEFKQQILALSGLDEWVFEKLFVMRVLTTAQTDEVVVKHFYHAPTSAMAGSAFSKGRYIMYVGDIKLIDTPLPYSQIPLVDYCSAPFMGTVFGYAEGWDLCSINQMMDQVISDCASNLSTFGRQCISVEEGTDFSADDLTNGIKVITRRPNTQAPEALQLTAIPNAAQWFLELLEKKYQTVSALNSVARGDPDANIKSGTMAALFHSIALEANSSMQQAVDSHRERLANLILDILKQYAYQPLVVRIAGVDERPYLDTFSRDKLLGIRGVTIKTSNPMMRTQAGRLQLAEYALKIEGAIQDPAQITELFVSGQIKPLYDSSRKRRMRIKLEDEMLLQGPPTQEAQDPPLPPLPNGVQPPQNPPYQIVPSVPVHFLDNHKAHINQHYALLASRESLQNQAVWAAVNTHIQHHMKVWRESDPGTLMAGDNQPFPQAPGAEPPQAGAAPGAPGGNGSPPGGGNPLQPTNPMQSGQDMGVQLPSPAQSPVPNNTPQAA